MSSDDVIKIWKPAHPNSPLGRLKAHAARPMTHWVDKHNTTILTTTELWPEGIKLNFRCMCKGEDLTRHYILSWEELEMAEGDVLGWAWERCLRDMKEKMDEVRAP